MLVECGDESIAAVQRHQVRDCCCVVKSRYFYLGFDIYIIYISEACLIAHGAKFLLADGESIIITRKIRPLLRTFPNLRNTVVVTGSKFSEKRMYSGLRAAGTGANARISRFIV